MKRRTSRYQCGWGPKRTEDFILYCSCTTATDNDPATRETRDPTALYDPVLAAGLTIDLSRSIDFSFTILILIIYIYIYTHIYWYRFVSPPVMSESAPWYHWPFAVEDTPSNTKKKKRTRRKIEIDILRWISRSVWNTRIDFHGFRNMFVGLNLLRVSFGRKLFDRSTSKFADF